MGRIRVLRSHSRYFWGLRLHLLSTLHGLPVGFALSGAKADERQTLLSLLAADPALAAMLPGQILIGDKNYYGHDFEAALAGAGACLLRPARQGEPERAGTPFFKPLARSSNRSTPPSKASSTSNAMMGTPRRGHHPHPAAHPGLDRRHLAQRPHQPTSQALPDRLRPLLNVRRALAFSRRDH